jgi:hypothetical protein
MIRFRNHLPFTFFYIILFIIGIVIYKDYGISWDEGMQRNDNGIVNYNYINYNNYDALINGNEKFHGPVVEIAFIYLEKAFGLKTSRDIYQFRHLLTFLIFFTMIFFFYRLLIDEFKNRWLALTGTLFLV